MYILVKTALLVAALAFGWRYYQNSTRLPPVVEGFFLPEFRPVAELFRQYVEEGTELGASLAVYQRGQALVELWGGYADPASRRPWRNNTVTMTWACTKGPAALAIATLVSRGLLNYKARIHQYWPEFAQNGKDNITVEMLMNHQAGLVTLGGHSISLLDYKHNWHRVQQIMASVAPDYPPGSEVVYHAVTFGMYVDAMIRQVDPQHRSLSQYFEEEIAKPFGLDFHIGLPLEQYHRTARQHFTPVLESLAVLLRPSYIPHLWHTLTAPNSLPLRAHRVLSFLASSNEILNDPWQIEVGLGSLMGFGSASSLAKMYDILANEGIAGSRVLLNQSLVDLLWSPVAQPKSEDHSNDDLAYYLGFQVSKNVLGSGILGHSGAGGQQAWADLIQGLGLAYVTNFHWAHSAGPPYHYLQLQQTLYNCLQQHAGPTDTHTAPTHS